VANDWRVTVTLHDTSGVGQAMQALRDHEVEDDVRRRLGHRVAVSAEGACIFLYAGTEDAAREADRVARELTAQRGLPADFVLERWHPDEEEWEDADVVLPRTAEERQAEHQRLEQEETRESVETGVAQWEVRVEMPSRRAAAEFEERLQAEQRQVVRRWTLLVLGANDEDDANALAQLIKQEAPAGTKVETEQLGPLLPFTSIGPIPIW